jgi:hypothetical protein
VNLLVHHVEAVRRWFQKPHRATLYYRLAIDLPARLASVSALDPLRWNERYLFATQFQKEALDVKPQLNGRLTDRNCAMPPKPGDQRPKFAALKQAVHRTDLTSLTPSGFSLLKPAQHLCLSQIKSEYIGDAARPGLEGEEYARLYRRRVVQVHPCSMTGEFARRCSRSCTTAVRDADGVRQI